MQQICVGPLVRAISASSVVIWAECAQASTVILSVTAEASPERQPLRIETRTVLIGGHHYVAPQLRGLRPASWYRYRLEIAPLAVSDADQSQSLTTLDETAPTLQCFRTLDASGTLTEQPLRVFYGSCRQAKQPTLDALEALGPWLVEHSEQREQTWPHVLLLIGDQIYADTPPERLIAERPAMKTGAVTLDDFMHQYSYVWTNTAQVRQALACIPTYMIFDDHEITNGWNCTPTWREHLLQSGQEQMLLDGMVAYWIYQGWGNLDQSEKTDHPLLAIMQQGERTGEDVLEALRACIKQAVYADSDLHWHYTIPTTPPIFVTDTRTNRSSTFSRAVEEHRDPKHIMSLQQTNELHDWLQAQQTGIALIVSSVPVLLPPFIGLAEYLAGARLWTDALPPLRWLGQQLARIQRIVAERAGFEHWPVYNTSWRDLIKDVTQQAGDVVILAGDVHFSYGIEGSPGAEQRDPQGRPSKLYQFVSTPIQNALQPKERRMIQGQAFIQRATYGGIATKVLPLEIQSAQVDTQHNLLFENTLACLSIRLHAQPEHTYELQNEYLGVIAGRLQPIGRTGRLR
jgi:phosphodiesterase/alkaline phosphatase D-like protein